MSHKCPICHETVEMLVSDNFLATLSCGHTIPKDKVQLPESSIEDYTSIEGKKLFPYQIDGVNLSLETPNKSVIGFVRVLIGDEMGLGKTVQAAAILKTLKATPCILVCKSVAKVQIAKEIIKWCGIKFAPQVIEKNTDRILGLPVTIISYGMIGRFAARIKELKPKMLILDECHLIKNLEADRSEVIREISRVIPHIIALSGTPIKNSAKEFFSIFNILRPDIFPDEELFEAQYIKRGRLRNIARFRQVTKDFVLRRERKQVMPELPEVIRTFHYAELPEDIEKIYLKEAARFIEDFDEYTVKSPLGLTSAMARLNGLRHLVGMAKTTAIAELAMEFLSSSEDKLCIFMHHKDAFNVLEQKLLERMKPFKPLTFRAGMSDDEIKNTLAAFETNPRKQVMILSTLAAGESLNLQFCWNMIMGERQWNPGNEEQAESRFPRPGTKATKVNAMYMIALHTVDEYFTTLVEQKREMFSHSMGKQQVIPWNESELVRDLIETIRRSKK